MMRTHARSPLTLTLLATTLLCGGCPKADKPKDPGKKPAATKPGKKTPAAKTPAAKTPAAKTAKTSATKKAPRLSPTQRKAYLAALARGRKLAKQQKWADAVKAFAAALEVLPMDGRALSEQGWAAFKIGDYKLARAANERSVLAATEPTVKAASLYNLGRTAEAMGKKEEAARYYLRSLKLRPHAGVEKRLVSLGKKAPARSVVPEVSEPCGKTKAASIAKICGCLLQQNSSPGAADKPSCGPYAALKTHSPALQAIKLDVPGYRSVTYLLLARQSGGKALFKTVAEIGYVYNPGAFGISESFDFAPTVVQKLGDRQLLKITSTKTRHDTDMGVDEFETHKVVMLTSCVLPRNAREIARCALQVPLEERYERNVLGLSKGKPSPADKKLHSRLPIKKHSKVSADFSADGKVSIKLTAGTRSPALAKKLGTHRLW
jgi:tetratricopeptide (TPR) repeat protein